MSLLDLVAKEGTAGFGFETFCRIGRSGIRLGRIVGVIAFVEERDLF